MRVLRSFFDEPQSYLFTLVTGLASFSALFFTAVENGLAFYQFSPKWLFNAFVLIYLVVPSSLPFYNLYLRSGGNKRAMNGMLAGFAILLSIVIVICKSMVSFFILLVWAVLFVGLNYRIRSSKRKNARPRIILGRNVRFELLFIRIALIGLVVFMAFSNFYNIAESPSTVAAFERFRDASRTGEIIDSLSNDMFIPQKFISAGHSFSKRDLDEYDSVIRRYNDLVKSSPPTTHNNKIHVIPKIETVDSLHFTNSSIDISARSILHKVFEDEFAAKFERVLRHYQLKGCIILVLSALMLLRIWEEFVREEEIANRARSHFFIALFLIIPLMRNYDKRDITIKKPFGFKFSDEERGNGLVQLDTLITLQTMLAKRVVRLEETTATIPKSITGNVANMLTNEEYLWRIEMLKDMRELSPADMDALRNQLKK
jgi:hypothetical protein